MIKHDKGTVIDSICIIVTSYGFLINFFPIYQALENKSNAKVIKATVIAQAFCAFVYIVFSFLAVSIYQDRVEPSIFQNLQKEDTLDSILIRVIFLLIFLGNIPFVFLSGKEALLMMIEELQTRTLSLHLMRHIDQVSNALLSNDYSNSRVAQYQRY